MFAKKKSWWLSNELGSLWMLSLLCSVLALTPPGFSSSLGDITWYSELIMPSVSSCLLLGCFDATTFLRRDHKFSIGFRSGLFPGQVSSSMLLSWNHFVHLRAVWHGAPSCWKTNSAPSPNMSRIEGNSFGSRTSWMYRVAFSIPFTTWIRPTPLQDMQPQIMTVTGCFMVGVKHSGKHSSPGLRRT